MKSTSIKMVLAAVALSVSTSAIAVSAILVHRDPGCGCCEQWANIVRRAFGRQVQIVDDRQRKAFARRQGVPADLASCHTAVIGGYVFEGHVPIADMRRLLASKPRGVQGLAVAGMPMGSPGMEAPGRPSDHFTVYSFGSGGRRVFARH